MKLIPLFSFFDYICQGELGTLTFGPEENYKWINVTIYDNDDPEDEKTFQVRKTETETDKQTDRHMD